MFELSLLICGLAVILCLWRVALGPTAYDRILAVNAVGSLVIIGITLHGFFMGRPEFIDIAILYALINFIGTIAILKLFSENKNKKNSKVMNKQEVLNFMMTYQRITEHMFKTATKYSSIVMSLNGHHQIIPGKDHMEL